MSIRYLREAALENLRSSVAKNLERYRTTGFEDYFSDVDASTRELKGNFKSGLKKLGALKSPQSRTDLFDVENSSLAYEALKKLTPIQAREERIWAYLCHFDCLDYVRKRWPIPSDDEAAVKHILTHFFAKSLRATERDNALSRLWWMGMIAGRAEGVSREDTLEVLMYRADVRANVIERPTTGTSVPVFSAVVRQLKASFDGKKILHERAHFRAFMKEINSAGGVLLLDSLGKARLDGLMKEIISVRLGLNEV